MTFYPAQDKKRTKTGQEENGADNSNRETLATSPPAPVENGTSRRSDHALAEAMFVVAFPVAGLIGALHEKMSLI